MVERKNWEKQLKNLKIEQAPDSLYQRISTVVPNLAQVQAGEQKPGVMDVLVRFMSDWNYGLALKIATFAVVAALGIAVGQSGGQEGNPLGSLIFGDIEWESVI